MNFRRELSLQNYAVRPSRKSHQQIDEAKKYICYTSLYDLCIVLCFSLLPQTLQETPEEPEMTNKVVDLAGPPKTMTTNGNFLCDSLRPLWKLTHYTGILFDWCVPLSFNASCSSALIRYCIMSLSVGSLVIMTIFQTYQMFAVIVSDTWDIIDDLVIHFIWFIPLPHTCWNVAFFITRRRELLAFFEKFHQLEKQTHSTPVHSLARRQVVFWFHAIFGLLLSVGIAIMICYYPEEFYFPTYYPMLRNIFTAPLLGIVEFVAFGVVLIYQSLTDLVPAFVYYHCDSLSAAIQNDLRGAIPIGILPGRRNSSNIAVVELEEKQDREGRLIHAVWSKYVVLRNLVKASDLMFGPLLLINYGMKFFMICMMTFSGLNDFRSTPLFDVIVPLVISGFYVFRLTCCVMLKSQLYRSRERLITELVGCVNGYWFDLSWSEREVLISLQEQVERDQLTASPLGLFSVTPGILLTTASLTLTYIIILMQSN